jgi:hypothetical protein
MDERMRICISSPPDREKLVAEIFFENEQWAELNQEHSQPTLEIYPRKDCRPWSLPFQAVAEALSMAKERLGSGRS